MIITAKSGRQNKMHIMIDGEYLLTVDDIFWFSYGFVSGDEIMEEELAAFEKAAGSRCAFNSAMNSLDRRDHSEKELRIKLLKKYDIESVDSAIEKLLDLNLINDERYAKNFARGLLVYKKYGKNRIKSELFKRGVDSETVGIVLDELFEEEEPDNVERIVEIIRKKYYNKMIDENGRKKVFAALVRLGYSFGDIREAMSVFSDDEYFEEW